jgi:hypothetical protein
MATSTATLEGPETRASAERAVQRMRESIAKAEHVRDEVIDRTKREPVKALAVAFGVGIAMGVLLGWTWRRPTTTN